MTLVFSLVITGLSFSASLFAVFGTVKNADGSVPNSSLQVIVNNETINLTVTTTINKEGNYDAVFISLDNVAVAKEGDTIKVTVKNGQAIVATRTYKLTSDDIAKARAMVPVNISGEVLKGDLNGDGAVKSNDAVIALRISAGLLEPTPQQLLAGDMNNDGNIRSNDALIILRKAVGLAPSYGKFLDKKVNISLGKIYGKAGQDIVIPLNIDNGDMVSSGDFVITYDKSAIRIIDISSDNDVLLESNLTESGKLRISFVSISKLGNSIANLHFAVLTDNLSPLTLQSVELYRSDALPIRVNKVSNQFNSLIKKPDNNLLLQNYPNPFNPETWIPYQLNKDNDVVIKIYSSSGLLIRSLNLGYKSAGFYASKDKAAFWDGKNEAGEQIASGIYFYSIQAKDFTATKMMVVTK
jgi:antitoxin component of MazEF toxin-antitoxin module